MHTAPRRVVAFGLSFLAAFTSEARSQGVPVPDSTGAPHASSLVTIGGAAEDRLRLGHLDGAPIAGFQFRSPSSLTHQPGGAPSGWRASLILPELRATYNSELPYSLDDGAMWAGRGWSALVMAGVRADIGRVHVILAPEAWSAQNLAYALPDAALVPPPRPPRSPFSSPWHTGAQSIDLPIRFGDAPLRYLTAGQSSLVIDAGPVALGAATENEWWGPGIRNALLLSNNAAGFPHLFLRTAAPVATPIGLVEGRWLAGGLSESAYFDDNPANDLRAISLLGVSLQPRGATGLVIGLARAAFGTTSGWASALTAFPRVFSGADGPDGPLPTDSTAGRATDAITTAFARWVLPSNHAEIYAEWGRTELPGSLRGFLEQPSHSQGYLLGLQAIGNPLRTGGRLRVQAEATYVEQSSSYRFLPLGSWYTSRTVVQGYTELGQPLGASIGPGGSTQWLSVDHLGPRWEAGAYVTRIRWLADAENQMPDPLGNAYCRHDVSLLPGVRGRATTPFGTVGADYSSGWRMNVFFEQPGQCFSSPARDQRNHSLTVTFSPGVLTLP